jgi:multiple sugar transport system ATP-binding protein
MADVSIQAISKRFNKISALDQVSLQINNGEFFVLLGPSGAGKTTTLRVIAGLERQDAGNVLFNGQAVDNLSPPERDVAFVFQQYSLYPTMSVYDNLAFPLRAPARRVAEDRIKQLVFEAAEKLRIGHLLDRKTARLSGGEMQRVSIGRAIVRSPQIFLMDEPLSNLDFKLRETLRVELKHVQKTQESTTLFVTHDQIEALTMADRIAVLHEGKVVQIGTPHDIYDRPATTFVAQLVGTPRINLVPVACENRQIRLQNAPISLPVPPQPLNLPQQFTLGVRPEDIQPASTGPYHGEIALIEPLGVETVVHIKTGEQTLVSTLPGTSRLRRGETLHFTIVPERLHYFAPNGVRYA